MFVVDRKIPRKFIRERENQNSKTGTFFVWKVMTLALDSSVVT